MLCVSVLTSSVVVNEDDLWGVADTVVDGDEVWCVGDTTYIQVPTQFDRQKRIFVGRLVNQAPKSKWCILKRDGPVTGGKWDKSYILLPFKSLVNWIFSVRRDVCVEYVL